MFSQQRLAKHTKLPLPTRVSTTVHTHALTRLTQHHTRLNTEHTLHLHLQLLQRGNQVLRALVRVNDNVVDQRVALNRAHRVTTPLALHINGGTQLHSTRHSTFTTTFVTVTVSSTAMLLSVRNFNL